MSLIPFLASDPGPLLYLFYIPYVPVLGLILWGMTRLVQRRPGGGILLGLGVLLLVVCECSIGLFANLVYSLLP